MAADALAELPGVVVTFSTLVLVDRRGSSVSAYEGGGVVVPLFSIFVLSSVATGRVGVSARAVDTPCKDSNFMTWRLTIAGTKGDTIDKRERTKSSAVRLLRGLSMLSSCQRRRKVGGECRDLRG